MARPTLTVKGYSPEQIKAMFRRDERYTIGLRLYAIYHSQAGSWKNYITPVLNRLLIGYINLKKKV